MEAPWYYLLIYVVIGSLILRFFDKKQIIKSKRLRYFIVIIVYTLICWGVYDLITGLSNGRMAIRALGNGTYRKRRIRGHKGHAGKFSG